MPTYRVLYFCAHKYGGCTRTGHPLISSRQYCNQLSGLTPAPNHHNAAAPPRPKTTKIQELASGRCVQPRPMSKEILPGPVNCKPTSTTSIRALSFRVLSAPKILSPDVLACIVCKKVNAATMVPTAADTGVIKPRNKNTPAASSTEGMAMERMPGYAYPR